MSQEASSSLQFPAPGWPAPCPIAPVGFRPGTRRVFNLAGQPLGSHKLTKEELGKLLPHMRAQVSLTRKRVPVRLQVSVDGAIVHHQAYRPKGISKDDPSLAIVRLPQSFGRHTVLVQLADLPDTNQWTRRWSHDIEFHERRVAVVLFDAKNGFSQW